jgi:TetR/AcrR family transcriptional repressor of mexJK operon
MHGRGLLKFADQTDRYQMKSNAAASPGEPAAPGVPTALSEGARKVLRAATTVFLSHGFSAASTDMIQREAGVSKSTVYAHFANKEALFVAVIEAECAAFRETVHNIAFEPGNLRRTLTNFGRAYLRIVLSPTGRALFRVVVAEAPRFPALGRTFFLAGPEMIAGLVRQQLARAVEAGTLDVTLVGLDTAANLFASLLRSDAQLQCQMHPGSTPSEAQLDRWVDVAVTTFLAAYGRD